MITSKTVKLLIFAIGSLHTALPIDAVQKIVNYSTMYGSGLTHFGVVNLGGRQITAIDLHKLLFHSPQTFPSEAKKYLILAKNSVGELFGIVTNQTPTLSDVSSDKIRTLPASYRQADTLAIASHVTLIPQEGGELTVFILDVDSLVPPLPQPETPSRASHE